jgi:hypothetical protein
MRSMMLRCRYASRSEMDPGSETGGDARVLLL